MTDSKWLPEHKDIIIIACSNGVQDTSGQGQGLDCQGQGLLKVGTCESEIFVRIETRIELVAMIRI